MTEAIASPTPSEQHLIALARTSYELILELQDASGAYPASPTFSAYQGYSWFRDGAFIADGVSSYGGVDSASRFFDWCNGVLLGRADQVRHISDAAAGAYPAADAEMLPTRFTLAGTEGEDDWWDFQLDGYGTWIWAVVEHAKRHGLGLARWGAGIELSVEYLVSSWQRPCFDWWEENPDQVHVSTLGCLSAGLRAAVDSDILSERLRLEAEAADSDIQTLIRERGTTDGHLVKWLGSRDVDASLLAVLAPLGAIQPSSEVGLATVRAVCSALNVDGGVHRYLADTFYGGGQWPLLSCMLGLAYSRSGDKARALRQLAWAAGTVGEDGSLPEQVGDHLLDPSRREEWVQRWGPVAQPLLWSHAMYIRLAVELGLTALEENR
jgi:GH15 family glucan-1,4-alpha-glucosidase